MNTIPTYVTSLSILHNGVVVQLNVQYLNDVFWGIALEQYLVSQSFSLILGESVPLSNMECLILDEEMPSLF